MYLFYSQPFPMKMKLFKQIEIWLHFQANFSENNLWYQFICPQYSKIIVILRISSFTDSKKKTKSFLDKMIWAATDYNEGRRMQFASANLKFSLPYNTFKERMTKGETVKIIMRNAAIYSQKKQTRKGFSPGHSAFLKSVVRCHAYKICPMRKLII